jgi:DNA invertase Pin-like site-specific DNA recombinase
MKIGYARVSTFEQTLDLQLDALKVEGCDRVYTDKVSGVKEVRPSWDKIMELARPEDTIVVWRLDRVGRGMKNLLEIMEYLEKNDINLKTLTGIEVDTTTATGRLIFRMVAAIIEYEREQIIERTKAGLAAAFARGRKGGRKPKLNPKQEELVAELFWQRDDFNGHKHSPKDLATQFRVSEPTIYRVAMKRKPTAGPMA